MPTSMLGVSHVLVYILDTMLDVSHVLVYIVVFVWWCDSVINVHVS